MGDPGDWDKPETTAADGKRSSVWGCSLAGWFENAVYRSLYAPDTVGFKKGATPGKAIVILALCLNGVAFVIVWLLSFSTYLTVKHTPYSRESFLS